MTVLNRGFTLIEVLVVMLILAMLTVMGYRGLTLLLDSQQRINHSNARWHGLDQLFTRFENDIRRALPRTVRSAHRTEPAMFLAQSPSVSELRFSRAATSVGDDGGQRIAYRWEASQISVIYWPSVDFNDSARFVSYGLSDEVQSLRFRVYSNSDAWTQNWPPPREESSLPKAVEMTIQLTSGEELTRLFDLQ